MTDERRKTAIGEFNEEQAGAFVETYMRALLMLQRASSGGATGPEAKDEIALQAARIMLNVADMFERLGVEGHDNFAREMGWPSAEELSRFLWEHTASAD